MVTWSFFLKTSFGAFATTFFLFLQVVDFDHNKNTKYYHDKFKTKLYYLVKWQDTKLRRETLDSLLDYGRMEWKKTMAMIQKHLGKESKFLDKIR